MNFGETLKIARKNKKYNQKELGELLGLGQTTIANYESNQRFPNKDILIKMSEVLEISMDHLLSEGKQEDLNDFSDGALKIIKDELFELLISEDYSNAIDYTTNLKFSKSRRIQLFEQVFVPILYQVGDLWESGTISIAKEHYISGIIFQLIVNNNLNTKDELVTKKAGRESAKKKVICLSIPGELHVIGLRIIADYLHSFGFEPIYLGNNVPTQALIEMAIDTNPIIIAFSLTLREHQDALRNIIEVLRIKLETKSLNKKGVKFPFILVGGQGIKNEAEALSLGADGFANNYKALFELLKERSIL